MNKNVLLATLATTLLTFTVSTQADKWEFLPVLNSDYQADAAVALIVGKTEFKSHTTTTPTKGIEVSLNCPLLKAPRHTIRQQISYSTTYKSGTKINSLELTPQHMFKMTNKLSLGVGPSLGYAKLSNSTGNDSGFTYGAAISARYNVTGNLFIGAEVKYTKSKDLEISGVENDISNTKGMLKIGLQF